MKKQKTLLIVVLFVAIVMVGLYVAMGLMDKGEGKKTTQKTEDSKVMVTDLDGVTYVQYTNPDSTVTLIKAGDLWTSEEQPELELVDGYVEEKVSALSQISGEVVKDAKKADCGLEEPTYTLVLKNVKESVKLYVGYDEDGNYYAMLDGKNEIYAIKDTVVNIMDMDVDSYTEMDDDMSSYYENMEAEDAANNVDDNEVVDDTVVEDPEEGMDDDDTTGSDENPEENPDDTEGDTVTE